MGMACDYICQLIIAAHGSSAESVDTAAVSEEDHGGAAEKKTSSLSHAMERLEDALASMHLAPTTADEEETVSAVVGEPEPAASRLKDNTELQIRIRNSLLDILLERVYDVSPFTRAAVLKVWSQLAVNHSIPVQRVVSLMELAQDRLGDKTAIVRKAAMQLMTALVEHNPFAPQLQSTVFLRRQQELETKMMERMRELAKELHEEEQAAATKRKKGKKAVKKEALPTIAEDEEEEEETVSDETEEEEGDGAPTEQELLEQTEKLVMQQAEAIQWMNTDEDLKQWNLELKTLVKPAIEFMETTQRALHTRVMELLQSKTQGDVVGALRLLSRAVAFRVDGATTLFTR